MTTAELFLSGTVFVLAIIHIVKAAAVTQLQDMAKDLAKHALQQAEINRLNIERADILSQRIDLLEGKKP